MFIYHNRLYEKHRLPILPIAYSSKMKTKMNPNNSQPNFYSKNCCFPLKLKKLPWRRYIQQDNPIAAALLSKMGHTKSEKIQVKKEFLRMLLRLQLDPARMYMLTGFFDIYLKLTEKEEQTLMEEIRMGIQRRRQS